MTVALMAFVTVFVMVDEMAVCLADERVVLMAVLRAVNLVF